MSRPIGGAFAVTGDETGLLKLVSFPSSSSSSSGGGGSSVVTYGGEQSRANGVESLCWTGSSTEEFAALHKNGLLHAWRHESSGAGDALTQRGDGIQTSLADQAQGVVRIDDERVLCYGRDGTVVVVTLKAGVGSDDLDSVASSTFKVTGPLATCASCQGGCVAMAGRENDVKLYDLSTQQAVWEAKNVSNDSLQLRVPIWVTRVAFLRPQIDSLSGGAHLITGTGHKHVRMYDTNLKRQPVISIDIGEFRVTSIFPAASSSSSGSSAYACYVGDTSGGIHLWDIRKSGKKLATLKGSGNGSVRDMAGSAGSAGSAGRGLACVGLDRHFRRFDTRKNKLVTSVYLKNRLNCCLFVSGGDDARDDNGDDGEDEEDEDGDDEDEDDDDVDNFAVGRKRSGGAGTRPFDVDNNEDVLEDYGDSDDEEEEEGVLEGEGEEVEDEDEDEEDEEDDEDEAPKPKSKPKSTAKPAPKHKKSRK